MILQKKKTVTHHPNPVVTKNDITETWPMQLITPIEEVSSATYSIDWGLGVDPAVSAQENGVLDTGT